MAQFVTDRRKVKRCPKEECKSKFLSFKVNPIPDIRDLEITCDTCGYTFKAERESDKHDFKKESQEFNS